MAEDPKFAPMQGGIKAGLSLIYKYTNLSEASDANIVCLGMQDLVYMPEMLTTVLVLDPNIEIAHFDTRWASERYNGAINKIRKVVRDFVHSAHPTLILA